MRLLEAVFVLVFVTETTIKASFVEDTFKKTQIKDLLTSCKDKSGATKEDFEMLRVRKIPETKSGQCLMECLFEKANIMNSGKFNKNGMVVALTPALKGDIAKLGKLKQLGQKCEDELKLKKFENCQGGKKILECLAHNGDKYGVEFVNIRRK